MTGPTTGASAAATEAMSRSAFRALLKEYGWRQGSVLTDDPRLRDSVKVLPFGKATTLPDGQYWLIVASHDCNVLHPDFDEDPVVELLVARPIAAVDPLFKNFRKPRDLHLELTRKGGSAQPVAVSTRDRATIDRRLLAQSPPSSEIECNTRTTLQIAQFMARNYARPALPDALDKRLTRVRERLGAFLKDHAQDVADVLFVIEPFEELPEAQEYHIAPHVILDDKHISLSLSEDSGAAAKLHALKTKCGKKIREVLWKVPGIRSGPPVVWTRADLSVLDYRDLREVDLESDKADILDQIGSAASDRAEAERQQKTGPPEVGG